MRPTSQGQWHTWEKAGIALGALLIVVNLFAILTPYLSGPFFHPTWVLLGVVAIYICAMLLGGADRDESRFDSADYPMPPQ
jgi:hypothetical protein